MRSIKDPGVEHQSGVMTWIGALAQLGERLHGMQEVSGSIPLGSTSPHNSNHGSILVAGCSSPSGAR